MNDHSNRPEMLRTMVPHYLRNHAARFDFSDESQFRRLLSQEGQRRLVIMFANTNAWTGQRGDYLGAAQAILDRAGSEESFFNDFDSWIDNYSGLRR